MTRLEKLNRKTLVLVRMGDITEEEYATYKALLESVAVLEEAYADNPGWRTRIEELMEKLK